MGPRRELLRHLDQNTFVQSRRGGGDDRGNPPKAALIPRQDGARHRAQRNYAWVRTGRWCMRGSIRSCGCARVHRRAQLHARLQEEGAAALQLPHRALQGVVLDALGGERRVNLCEDRSALLRRLLRSRLLRKLLLLFLREKRERERDQSPTVSSHNHNCFRVRFVSEGALSIARLQPLSRRDEGLRVRVALSLGRLETARRVHIGCLSGYVPTILIL